MAMEPNRILCQEIADDELLYGHTLTAVAGWAPSLEISIALSSIGQDELGHAEFWFHKGSLESLSYMVYERPVSDFRCATIAYVNSLEWEVILIKGLIYDAADAIRLRHLASWVSEVRRMQGEEHFHRIFWRTWLRRTVLGSAEGRVRVQGALNRLWPLRREVFHREGLVQAYDADMLVEELEFELAPLATELGLVLLEGDPWEADLTSIVSDMRAVWERGRGFRW